MRAKVQYAVYLLALLASGCAAKNPATSGGPTETLKNFPRASLVYPPGASR